MNNLKIVDFYEDDECETYYISRMNEKMPWPGNSSLAIFVTKGNKLKKYKILSIGDQKTKVVVIKK
jgi:hypothetical protein